MSTYNFFEYVLNLSICNTPDYVINIANKSCHIHLATCLGLSVESLYCLYARSHRAHFNRASQCYSSGGNNIKQYSWTVDSSPSVKGQQIIKISMTFNENFLVSALKLLGLYLMF